MGSKYASVDLLVCLECQSLMNPCFTPKKVIKNEHMSLTLQLDIDKTLFFPGEKRTPSVYYF